MIIYNPDGTALISVDLDDESYHFAEVMGRDDVTLYFSLADYVAIPEGAYIEWAGGVYTLYSVDNMRMQHRRDYEYTLTMQSPTSELSEYIFTNINDGRFKFPLTARPSEHLSLLTQCMTAKTGQTWTYSVLIEESDKPISYDAMTCLDALKQMADTFGTEYRVANRCIYFGKVEFYTDPQDQTVISYGKGNGLRPGIEKVTDDSEKIIGRVYIQGGERNIDFSQYGSSTLLLPKNRHIWFDGTTFYDVATTGATEFVTSSDGRSVALAAQDAPNSEGALDLSDVYPCYDHEVDDVEIVDAANHFWDIYSDTFTAGTSTATKVNYGDTLIENGQDMTIIFQSGRLSGREFGVKWKTKTVNNSQVAYMEIVPSEQDGITMPDSTSGFYPADGDTFRVFNVYLPTSYILSAELEALRQAVRYLYDNCRHKFSIKGEIDPIWASSRWLEIGGKFKPGAWFRFVDPTWESDGVAVRIMSVKTFVNKPKKPIVEFSNSTARQGVSTALKKVEAEAKTLPDQAYKQSLSFTKRSYRDAQETMAAIAQALIDGFSDSISPITVQTMQMLVGSEALQFLFYTDRTCATAVTNPFTYDSSTKKLSASACALKHMTLGIDDIKPSAGRTNSEYLRWTMTAYESPALTDRDKLYYIYAKCDNLNDGTNHLTGTFMLSEDAIPMTKTPDDGYYYFLCGILNSEREDSRSLAPLWGYTEILPGQITTDVIRGSSGTTWWDLINGAFNLGDKLKWNVNNSGQLVLNGTMVQSGSGAVSEVGVWCGPYDGSRTYQKGDEVSVTSGSTTSTYRYINSTPSSGHDPASSPTYWQISAAGNNGQGVFKSIVFLRSASTPSAPSGGSYLSPVPSGWSDGVPSGNEMLWMSTRVFTSDGLTPQESSWTTPEKATSGDDVDYRWSDSSSEPSPPGQDSGSSLAWTASTNVNWIHLGSSSGSGAATLNYTVDANTGTSPRTGTITISYTGGSKTFTITQSGNTPASGSISPTTVSAIASSGGTQTFTITDSSNVGWSLSSNVAWITLSSSSGTGGATVTATIASNSGSARSGVLTFICGSTTTSISVSQSAGGAQGLAVSYPSSISTNATTARFTISDPNNIGWCIYPDEWYGFGQFITGGTVISGNASASVNGAAGTGNAVVDISFSSGSSTLNYATFRATTSSSGPVVQTISITRS